MQLSCAQSHLLERRRDRIVCFSFASRNPWRLAPTQHSACMSSGASIVCNSATRRIPTIFRRASPATTVRLGTTDPARSDHVLLHVHTNGSTWFLCHPGFLPGHDGTSPPHPSGVGRVQSTTESPETTPFVDIVGPEARPATPAADIRREPWAMARLHCPAGSSWEK